MKGDRQRLLILITRNITTYLVFTPLFLGLVISLLLMELFGLFIRATVSSEKCSLASFPVGLFLLTLLQIEKHTI